MTQLEERIKYLDDRRRKLGWLQQLYENAISHPELIEYKDFLSAIRRREWDSEDADVVLDMVSKLLNIQRSRCEVFGGVSLTR
ncbi:MAG: hypothetical protein UY48_C0005G0002 [Candidatus Gottesmanbacteria bacterium GW2011_GWB1_49_7]|uniref:Uncharacterized protein n=1 Tax=Candidatus Gottesmanbacteria bacterium GW2011_GWB1_49_7 TaxID=1618448 RepID=A0A0G1W2Q7_9BACT|nr:MAG: hypothetical protein UY48_C0005G0002 [Candidatus Gottesmanbacteria bacterium GW2011_GWB1_49_7]